MASKCHALGSTYVNSRYVRVTVVIRWFFEASRNFLKLATHLLTTETTVKPFVMKNK